MKGAATMLLLSSLLVVGVMAAVDKNLLALKAQVESEAAPASHSFFSCPADATAIDATSLQAYLCYPPCPADYAGVGPLCHKRCPPDYPDSKIPLHCQKKSSYGRGTGYGYKIRAPSAQDRCRAENPQGCEKWGLLWYPKCAAGFTNNLCCMCVPDNACPDGFTNTGAACLRPSFGRTAGKAPSKCTTKSFWKTNSPAKTTAPSYYLVSSDPQLYWYEDTKDHQGNKLGHLFYANCDKYEGAAGDRCVEARGKLSNDNHLNAMKSVSALPWPQPNSAAKLGRNADALVIDGDLTAFWHAFQAEAALYYFDQMPFKVFPGLGNHDYSNNWNDGFGGTLNRNGAAERATQWMRGVVNCNRFKNFPATQIVNYDDGSMAYSWDEGSYHFIQLHNRPNYPDQKDWDTMRKNAAKNKVSEVPFDPLVTQSLTFLRQDLERATAAGKYSFIHMHDFDEKFTAYSAEFQTAIKGQRVAGVFSGHIHEWVGLNKYIRLADGTQTKIPHFNTGSSVFQSFLLVEMGATSYRVVAVDSKNGAARWLKTIDDWRTSDKNKLDITVQLADFK